MAGIGFRLQKLLEEGTYFGFVKGFFYATYLIAGPWIVTVTVIGLLNWFSRLTGNDYDIFRTSIVLIYAYSLLITGLYQMPITRYLADELYAGRLKSLAPAWLGMVIVVTVAAGTIGFVYALLFPLGWFFRLTFAAGLVIVSLLWLSGVFLSCLRDFSKIGFYYVIGTVGSLCLTLVGERWFGLGGALFGFIAGQGMTLLGLGVRILTELGMPGLRASFVCLGSLRRYPTYLAVGFLYNLAIWIDKFLFWISPLATEPCRGLAAFGIYDTSIFLAYITIIPALGIYLMNIETTFYETYRDFYGVIMRQQPLRAIIRRHGDIVRNLRFMFFEMVKVQGSITLLIWYFAPEILDKIHYPPELVTTLRWGVWGAFFQVLFLFVSLIMLYFEFTREALWGNAMFLGVNAAVTAFVIHLHLADCWAMGYLLSTVAAFLLSSYFLAARLRKLIYLTFAHQPIPNEVIATGALLGPDGRLGEIIVPASGGQVDRGIAGKNPAT